MVNQEMEKENKDAVQTDLPDKQAETVKKEEADLLTEKEESSQDDSSEQSHEIDLHKKDEPSTFLPFGGE